MTLNFSEQLISYNLHWKYVKNMSRRKKTQENRLGTPSSLLRSLCSNFSYWSLPGRIQYMVFLLYGSAWNDTSIWIEKSPDVRIALIANKCIEQVELPISLQTCASLNESPPNKNSMAVYNSSKLIVFTGIYYTFPPVTPSHTIFPYSVQKLAYYAS